MSRPNRERKKEREITSGKAEEVQLQQYIQPKNVNKPEVLAEEEGHSAVRKGQEQKSTNNEGKGRIIHKSELSRTYYEV